MGYRAWFAGGKMFKMAAASVMAVGLSGCATMYGDGYGYGGGYYDDGYGYNDGYNDGYYNDGYYDDGYGYDDYYYDDYRLGYPNIGFGGGWYNNYYYPGYGTYLYDRSGQHWAMNQYYRNYWGRWRDDYGRRHDRDWDRKRGRGDGFNPGRIYREATNARPTQGRAPAMRQRPENINRSTAQVIRDGNRKNGRNGGARNIRRADPATQERINQRRQYQNRNVAPVVGTTPRSGGALQQMNERRRQNEAVRRSQPRSQAAPAVNRAEAQRRAVQQRAVQQRQQQRQQVAPARQQSERAAPAQQRQQRAAPVQQRQQRATQPSSRNNPRDRGGQVRED